MNTIDVTKEYNEIVSDISKEYKCTTNEAIKAIDELMEDDWIKIASDFKMIGKDLKKAMKRFEQSGLIDKTTGGH